MDTVEAHWTRQAVRYTPRCHRCLDIEAGAYGTKAHHSDECRLRIHVKYYENNDKKWQTVEGRRPKQAEPASEKEEIRLEGIEKLEPDAMEQPMAPNIPLSKSDHFQSDERVSHGMRAPANPLGGPSEAGSYGRQDVGDPFDVCMALVGGRR